MQQPDPKNTEKLPKLLEKFLDDLDKELFVDEYTYHHKYERNNDILLFDNCITLHNRQGSPIERVAYREPCDYAQLIPDG